MLATPIGKAPENTQKHSVAYRIYSHIEIKKKNPVPSVNSDSMKKCVLESHALMVGEGECLYISEIFELLLFFSSLLYLLGTRHLQNLCRGLHR